MDDRKRIGWVATAVFLELNSFAASTAPNGDVYVLVMDVAAGNHSIEEIAVALRRLAGVGLSR